MNNCQNTCSSGLKQVRLLQRNFSPLTMLHFTPVSQKNRADILFKTLKGKWWKIHRHSARFQFTSLSTYLTHNLSVGLLGFHRRQNESQTILCFKQCLQHPLNSKKELEVAAELIKTDYIDLWWEFFSLFLDPCDHSMMFLLQMYLGDFCWIFFLSSWILRANQKYTRQFMLYCCLNMLLLETFFNKC